MYNTYKRTYIINIPRTDMYVQAKWECSQHVLYVKLKLGSCNTHCLFLNSRSHLDPMLYQRNEVGKSFSG